MEIHAKRKNRSIYHWVILVCCVLTLMFTYSTRFSLSQLFSSAILEETGFASSAYFLCTTVASVVCIFTSPIAGKLMRGKYMRPTFLICCIGTMGFYSCYGFCRELWQFWLVGGLQGLFAMGACTIPVNVLITNWFEKHRGLMISVAMTGISIGGMVLSPIISWAIRSYGWRNAYFMLGAMCMVVLIPIAGFIVRRTPEEVGLEPYGHGEAMQETGKKTKTAQTKRAQETGAWNADLSELRKSPVFWSFVLGAFLIYLTSCIMGHMSYYLRGQGFDAASVAAYISLYSFVAIFGKLILGWIFDRFGSKAGILFGCGTFFLFLVCFFFVQGSQFMLYLSAVFYGFGTCAVTITTPIMITTIFGTKHYSEIYGFVSSFTMTASAIGPSCIGLIYDLTGSYKPAIAVLAVLSLLMIVIMFSCIDLGKKRSAQVTAKLEHAAANNN